MILSKSCGDAVAGKPGQGAGEEGDGAMLALVRQQLGVGKPARIIDGDVQMVPADAAVAALAGAVAGDAVADC